MARVKWENLSVGDFFIVNISSEKETLLYQKVDETDKGYNTILINEGKHCCVASDSLTTFEKVEVTFNVKPTE